MNQWKRKEVVLGKDKIEGLWTSFENLKIQISLKEIVMSLQCQCFITLAFGPTTYISDLKKNVMPC